MTAIGKRLLSRFFSNCAHPRGTWGRLMLRMMNRGHGRVYRWVMDSCPFADGMRVLDVGCGGGGAARALRMRFPAMRVDGVDISEASIQMARRVAGAGGEFRVATADALPFADGSHDAAISIESVYFWPDLPAGLREMRRVVRPGGFAAAAVECADPAKAQVWTDLVGPGMHVRTAVDLASAFRGAGFSGVATKVDPKTGTVCVFGHNDGGGGL